MTDRAPTIRQLAEELASKYFPPSYRHEAILFAEAVAARAEQRVSEFVGSRDFYELMQVYRHMPRHELQATVDAFEAVKAAIRSAAGREA